MGLKAVRSPIGENLLNFPKLGLKLNDDTAIVGTAPDARRSLEDFQFAAQPVARFNQLRAKGLF